MSDAGSPTPTSIRTTVAQLLIEQAQRWNRGDRILAEALLAKYPTLAEDVEATLDLIYNEFLLRQERGEQPEVAEYIQRFPRFADLLRVQFAADEAMNIGSTFEPMSEGSQQPAGAPRRAAPLPCIPGYEVLEEVGRGGMGIVYRARHQGLDRIVAVKMVRSDSRPGSDDLARFRREAEIVARLQHPNIVQIHDVGEHDGQPFLALEYVEGGSLAQRLAGKPQPARQSAEVVAILARAIHHAHERDVIHRDLKPANVLLEQSAAKRGHSSFSPSDGEKDECPLFAAPKITDFGLARRIQLVNITRTDAILGTPSYMAPEQAEGKSGEISPATDVYALGAILYEMLTGRPPFCAQTPFDTLAQVLVDDPVPPRRLQPRLPHDLETICLKCLQKESHHRYLTARELAEDLDRFLESRPIRARPIGPAGRLIKWARRQPVVAALLVLLAIVASVGFGLVTWKWLEAQHEWRRAELALEQAQEARREAEGKQRAAEEAEGRATASAASEKTARQKADRMAGVLAVERGQALGEQGDPGRALLWLVRSLEIATEAGDVDLQRAVRMGLEDWRRQIYPLQMILPYASGPSMAVSPDGKTVASGGGLNSAIIWDIATGKPVPGKVFTHDGPGQVQATAFSPDGKTLLTGGQDHKAHLWDVATGKRLLAQPLSHPAAVEVVAFSPDGRTLLTGCGHVALGEGRLWEASSGKQLGKPLVHKARVHAIAFSPDGKRVVTGSDDGTARLWGVETAEPLGEVMQHGGDVTAIAFSPGGKTVLTGSTDRTARLWDATTGKPALPPLSHSDMVLAVACSPDGHSLLTACRGDVRVWETASGQMSRSFTAGPGLVFALRFSHDGKTLLTGDAGVRLWEWAGERRPGTPLWQQTQVSAVAFSPDGAKVLTTSGPTVQFWNVTDGKPIEPLLLHDGVILAVAFGADGKTVLTGSGDRTARLWDAATGKPIAAPLNHQGGVSAVALSPDCRTALTGSQDGTARLWDVATGKAKCAPLEHNGYVTVVAFSPNGKRFLTAAQESKFATLWDTETGKQVGKPLSHQYRVVAAAFSPDSRAVVTGGSDRIARAWDTATGEPVSEPLQHAGYVLCVAFTPDGKTLLTGGDNQGIRMREAPGGKLRATLWLHEEDIWSLSLSPDGKTGLTGSWDHTARFWDTSTRTLIGAPLRHPDRAATVAYSPDGRTVLTLDGRGAARLWRAPAPLAGEVSRIKLWAEVLTGMSLTASNEEGGIVRVLGGQDWETRRKRLEALGGLQ